MRFCATCDEPIKHDDGLTCAACDASEHEACAEGWRRDAGGDTFCASCGNDPLLARAKIGAAKHAARSGDTA